MSLYSTDYDTWLTQDNSSQTHSEYLRDQEIERIMDEHNLDWDEAEEFYEEMMKTAEEENAASLAEDMAYFSQEDYA